MDRVVSAYEAIPKLEKTLQRELLQGFLVRVVGKGSTSESTSSASAAARWQIRVKCRGSRK
jgi:hypothetical protein